MPESDKQKILDDISNLIDRWSFEQCAYCKDGILISIEGMLDFKCSKCGKTMNPLLYLGEIAKAVYSYREKLRNPNEQSKIE